MRRGLSRGEIIAFWVGRRTIVQSLAYQRSERLLIVEVAEPSLGGKLRLRQLVWQMPTNTQHWSDIDSWLRTRAGWLLDSKNWLMIAGLSCLAFEDELLCGPPKQYDVVHHCLLLPEEQCSQLGHLVEHLTDRLSTVRERCAYLQVDFDPETGKPRVATRPAPEWTGE